MGVSPSRVSAFLLSNVRYSSESQSESESDGDRTLLPAGLFPIWPECLVLGLEPGASPKSLSSWAIFRGLPGTLAGSCWVTEEEHL